MKANNNSKNAKKRIAQSKMPGMILTRGSLPSIRASSVDVLRIKTRDNECYTFDLQITPLVFVPTAGVLKARFQMQTGAVALLSNLMACFEEVRFLGVRLRPKLLQLYNNPTVNLFGSGYMKLWIDDAILTTAVPTYSDAFSRQTIDVDLSPAAQPITHKQEMQWIATDDEDLDWISIPTGTPSSFCPFTVAVFCAPGLTPGLNSGTGTSIADSVTTVSLDGAVRVQLRTLRSP